MRWSYFTLPLFVIYVLFVAIGYEIGEIEAAHHHIVVNVCVFRLAQGHIDFENCTWVRTK